MTIPEILDDIPQMASPQLVPLASPSCQQVCTALAAAQGEFETPKRTKEATVKGQTRTGGSYDYKYLYAPLEEIIRAVRDAMAKNGLFRQQYLVTKGNVPCIRTIIWHTSGEWIASDYPIHQSRDGAQGFAAGVTYARRYGLSLALGLAPEDDDDASDGGAKIADAGKTRRPAPPAPNPMQQMPPHDPETGEIIEAATATPLDDAQVALRDSAREAAKLGRPKFSAFWRELTEAQRTSLAPLGDELGRLMQAAPEQAR